jgi:hypothetical protein
LAVAVADGAAFCYLAGKLSAFKAQFDALIECTSRYLAEFIISGDTALLFIRTDAFCHARAFLTSDSAYAYFHLNLLFVFVASPIVHQALAYVKLRYIRRGRWGM